MTQVEREIKMIDIFNSNVSHINNCDIVLAVIDNYDTGTVL